MRGGNIDALIMIGTNPVYSLPPELGFADALANVGASIHLGVHVDETARAVGWHIPRSHALEAWGDGRAYDGTRSEEHTSELQSRGHLVCRLLLEKENKEKQGSRAGTDR